MKKPVLLLAFGLSCFLAAGVGTSAQVGPASHATTSTDTGHWLAQNYDLVIDRLMPLESSDADFLRRDKWAFTFRIMPSPDSEPEFWCALVRTYEGQARLEVVIPRGPSVVTQLIHLHTQHPESSAQQLADMIRVDRVRVTCLDPRQIETISRTLEDIRHSTIMSDALLMDPSGYQFYSEARSGDLRMSLQAPASGGTHSDEPLIRWAEDARARIMGCLSAAQPSH